VKYDTEFICPNPNCDYAGKPAFEGYGSVIAAIVLLLLGIIPGLIYWAFGMGVKYICPKCKMVLDKD
jgi:hypothetical protein